MNVERITVAEYLRHRPASGGKGRKRPRPSRAEEPATGPGRWRCGRCGEELLGSADAAQRHVNGHGGGRLEVLTDA